MWLVHRYLTLLFTWHWIIATDLLVCKYM
jgi:hypothetical protein